MKTICTTEQECKSFLEKREIKLELMDLIYNEYVLIGRHVGQYKGEGLIKLCKFQEKSGDFTIPMPKQNFAYVAAVNACTDPDIPLVVLRGAAGSGKTTAALSAAAYCTDSLGMTISFIKENCPSTDYPLGFLKGSLEDKERPLFSYLDGVIEFINQATRHKEYALDQSIISIETPSFILGKTFRDTFVIVDESQNINPQIIELIVTRAGSNCKMIFVGDENQTYNQKTTQNSGLGFLCKVMNGSKYFASVNLGVSDLRSPLVKEFLIRKEAYLEK